MKHIGLYITNVTGDEIKFCTEIQIGGKSYFAAPNRLKLADAKQHCKLQHRTLTLYSERISKLYFDYGDKNNCITFDSLMFGISNLSDCYIQVRSIVLQNTTLVKKSCYQKPYYFLCEENKKNKLQIKPTSANIESEKQLISSDNLLKIIIMLSIIIVLLIVLVSKNFTFSYI